MSKEEIHILEEAEELYKAEAPPAGEGAPGEQASSASAEDEDVIDAEYTEEKNDS